MNQIRGMMPSAWTESCGPGNGPWVFCCSSGKAAGMTDRGGEKCCERQRAEKSWQCYPCRQMENHILHTAHSCINSSRVSHLPSCDPLSSCPGNQDLSYAQPLLLTPDSEIYLAFQKPVCPHLWQQFLKPFIIVPASTLGDIWMLQASLSSGQSEKKDGMDGGRGWPR